MHAHQPFTIALLWLWRAEVAFFFLCVWGGGAQWLSGAWGESISCSSVRVTHPHLPAPSPGPPKPPGPPLRTIPTRINSFRPHLDFYYFYGLLWGWEVAPRGGRLGKEECGMHVFTHSPTLLPTTNHVARCLSPLGRDPWPPSFCL